MATPAPTVGCGGEGVERPGGAAGYPQVTCRGLFGQTVCSMERGCEALLQMLDGENRLGGGC